MAKEKEEPGDGSGFEIPGSLWLALVRASLIASLWIVRRPFLMSRRRWAFVLAVAVLLDVLAWTIGPTVAGLALVVPPLVISAVLAHWWWLGRGTLPIVFVSLFEGRSKLGREAAESHFGALSAFLREEQGLDALGGVEVREVPIALASDQAERLLRISRALVVIRGSGDAVADISRWEWWAHFRDQPPPVMIMKYEYSLRSNQPRRSLARRLKASAPTAEVHDSEGDLELKAFVATTIAVAHFRSLAAVLLLLRSEVALQAATREDLADLGLPELDAANLPPTIAGRGMALQAVAELRRGDEHLDVLTGLQESLLAGVGDADFGLWLTNQWFAASVERRIAKGEALRRVLEIVDRFPTNPHILLNAAGAAVEGRELGLADDLVDRAEEENRSDSGIARLRANVAWERGRPALALELYKEASKKGPPQTWQIGDCYAALGKNSRALRCYRKVLRRDATAADALLHARALLETPQLLATMPGGWRGHLWNAMHARPFMVRPLLWLWRRLRPEDPFLPIWLARHALIVDDLEVARRWLILTTRKEGTNRLIVTIDSLVVARLLGEGDPFRSVQILREHMEWLEARLPGANVHLDAERVLRKLAGARPEIFDGDVGPEVRAMFSDLSLSVALQSGAQGGARR